MATTMRQLQGMRHSPCSSHSLHKQETLNKCSSYVDSVSTQRLSFSSELVSKRSQKPLIITAYRSTGQNHQFTGHVSKSQKHTAEFSYMTNVFKVRSLAANGPLPCVSKEKKITVEGITVASEQVESSESPEPEVEIHKREWEKIWEIVAGYFMTLDATVKITMLIFILCYVTIRVIHGIEVLKQLTPLWIVGPLIVAFDIKMFQAISQLYVFSFKQAEKAIRSIPSPKKLTEATYTYILQKFGEVKSSDYKNTAKLKLSETMQWKENVSGRFFTLVWPLYWRIIRFLTRANLISPKF